MVYLNLSVDMALYVRNVPIILHRLGTFEKYINMVLLQNYADFTTVVDILYIWNNYNCMLC